MTHCRMFCIDCIFALTCLEFDADISSYVLQMNGSAKLLHPVTFTAACHSIVAKEFYCTGSLHYNVVMLLYCCFSGCLV